MTIKLWYLIGLRIVHRREITGNVQLSIIRSVIMVNSVQPWLGWGYTTSPFTLPANTSIVVVYATAERAGTLLLFLLCGVVYGTKGGGARTLIQSVVFAKKFLAGSAIL